MCVKQLCDVSAEAGSADASLVVAFVCKVNERLLLVVLWRTCVRSPLFCTFHCSFTARRGTFWLLRPDSWVCPCKCSHQAAKPHFLTRWGRSLRARLHQREPFHEAGARCRSLTDYCQLRVIRQQN